MNFDQMMTELRTEYIASMPGKIDEIRALAAAKDSSGLREAFHKLKGSGKTYGVDEVSELFAVCEKLCLDKPQISLQVAHLALKIFISIYESRITEKSFNITIIDDFKKLCAM